MTTKRNSKYFKTNLGVLSTKDTLPLSTAGTGTVSTSGNIYTTSAADQLQTGDWIVDTAQDTCRMVVCIVSTTTGRLGEAFPSNVAAIALQIVKEEDIEGVFSINVAADKGGDIEVNGVVVADGTAINPSIPEAAKGSMYAPIQPLVVDGSVNNATYMYLSLVNSGV